MSVARRPKSKKPVYLMLRGLGRESGHWSAFISLMQRRYDVITLDLPGTGLERHRPSPASIQGIVDDLRRRWAVIVQAKGIRHADLLAISLGGMVAMDWIGRYPSDFGRLVLINSSSNLSPFYHRLRPASYLDFLRAALSKGRREEIMFNRTCNSDASRDESIRLWMDLAAKRPLSMRTFFKQIAAASRFKLPRSLGIPVLVLSSSRDRLVDARCSQAIERHLGSCLGAAVLAAKHPWAGHDLTTDDGGWVMEELRRFETTYSS